MRATVVAALLATSVAANVGPAHAGGSEPRVRLDPGLALTVEREPGRSGVRRARLSGWIDHTVRDGFSGPQLVGGSLMLPRGLALHGGSRPRCSARAIRQGGTRGCPRRSIVGQGPGRGRADARATVEDGFTDVYYEYLNGGRRRIWAAMTIFRPALVVVPLALDLSTPKAARWSYRIDFELPAIMRVLAGEPVRLRTFALGLDGIDRAPGYLTFDRDCPSGRRLRYRASLTFLHGDGKRTTATRAGRLRCETARDLT